MSYRILKPLCRGFLVAFLSLPLAAFAADFEVSSLEEAAEVKRKVLASHFLMRTTFGPTEPEVDALAKRIEEIGTKPAYEEWIDAQFNDYPLASNWKTFEDDRGRLWGLTKKMLRDMGYRERNLGESSGEDQGVYNRNQWKEHAWWHRALTSKDQLRQRMAWALSQIFVVAEGPGRFSNRDLDSSANPRWLGLPKYYDDVCINHAFGNYRELLDTMTYSPAMGTWLTTVRNKKANERTGSFPDENYARELMQLFSIGVVEIKTNGEAKRGANGEGIETYDNETITALARVFTGLTFNNNKSSSDSIGAGTNLHAEMEMYEREHDFDEKVAFDGRLVIPARSRTDANARKDIADVLDFLAYEHENTAPFICRQLIQRLVMSNPSKFYVRRVANVWNENKENPKQFEEVIKAILLDRVAMHALRFKTVTSPKLAVQVTRKYPTERTRLREPVLRYTAIIRAYSPYPDKSFLTISSDEKIPYFTPGGPEGTAGNQYYFIDNNSDGLGDSLAQAPFESESVFNFYLPSYQSPGAISNYVPSARVIDGKLVSPEFQILSPVTAVQTMNHLRRLTMDTDFDIGDQWEVDEKVRLDVNLTFDRYFANGGTLGLAGTEPTSDQVNKFIESLDMKLCAGTMSQATKKVLFDVIDADLKRYNVDSTREKEDLVQAIISAVVCSPDFAVIP